MVSLNNNFFKLNQNKLNSNIKLGNVQQNNPTTVKNAGSGLKNINPVSISSDSPTISLNDGNFNFDFNFDNLQQVNVGGSFKRNTVSGGLRFNFLKKDSAETATTTTNIEDVKNGAANETNKEKPWTGSTTLNKFLETTGTKWSDFMNTYADTVDFSSLPETLQPKGTITIKENDKSGEKPYVASYEAPEEYTTTDNAYKGYTDPESSVGTAVETKKPTETKGVKNGDANETNEKAVWTGSTQLKDFYKTAGQTWSSFMEEFSEKVDFSSLPKTLQPEGTITIKEKEAFGVGEKNYVAIYDASTVTSAMSTTTENIEDVKNGAANKTDKENPWTGSTTLNKFHETTGTKWSDFMNTYADTVDFSSLPKDLQPTGTITIKENDKSGEKPYIATYEAPKEHTTTDNAYKGYTDSVSSTAKDMMQTFEKILKKL